MMSFQKASVLASNDPKQQFHFLPRTARNNHNVRTLELFICDIARRKLAYHLTHAPRSLIDFLKTSEVESSPFLSSSACCLSASCAEVPEEPCRQAENHPTSVYKIALLYIIGDPLFSDTRSSRKYLAQSSRKYQSETVENV
jgi:hypothetical protein